MSKLKENKCERCGDLFETGQEDVCEICAEEIEAEEKYREKVYK